MALPRRPGAVRGGAGRSGKHEMAGGRRGQGESGNGEETEPPAPGLCPQGECSAGEGGEESRAAGPAAGRPALFHPLSPAFSRLFLFLFAFNSPRCRRYRDGAPSRAGSGRPPGQPAVAPAAGFVPSAALSQPVWGRAGSSQPRGWLSGAYRGLILRQGPPRDPCPPAGGAAAGMGGGSGGAREGRPLPVPASRSESVATLFF